jgi:hypothetical protein
MIQKPAGLAPRVTIYGLKFGKKIRLTPGKYSVKLLTIPEYV